MKKVGNLIRSYEITARIIGSFTILVIVPYLCLAVFTYIEFQRYSVSSLGKTTMDTLTIAADNIHSSMRAREEDTMSVYYNDCVDLLEKDHVLNDQDRDRINGILSAICYSNTEVTAAYLESKGELFHSGGNYQNALTIMKPYKDDIIKAKGKCRWYATDKLHGNARQYDYILARSLNSTKEQSVGILYLVVSSKMIRDAFGELSAEYADWYLTDAQGAVFYSSDPLQTGDLLDVSALSIKKKRNYQTVRNEGQKREILAAYCLMDVCWFCISKINVHAVQVSARQPVFPFVVISVIYFVFLFVMLYIMQKYVLGPLRALKESIDQYAQSELGETQIELYGIGEFQSLSEHFNHMTSRIERLLDSYKKESDEKNRQKMKALAAQLTPHFIYNALNTIKWVAVLNQQHKIQSLVEALISIFMNTARADDENYTLKDEMELIQNYSVIQKTRFMNFSLVIDTEPAALDCHIRKLLIQPVVENAIVHGLGRGKIQNAVITVKAWISECLYITVEDPGIGFDVERWRRSPGTNTEHTNIGIHNIEEIIEVVVVFP